MTAKKFFWWGVLWSTVYAIAACSGGTTGTSVVGKRLLLGMVSDEQMAPVANAVMTVTADPASASKPTAASGGQTSTDENGGFTMPALGRKFLLTFEKGDLSGTTRFAASLPAPSTLFFELQATSTGLLNRSSFHEASLHPTSACREVFSETFEGSVQELMALQAVPATCSLRLTARSMNSPVRDGSFVVKELCGHQREVVTGTLDAKGEANIEITSAQSRGCTAVEITLLQVISNDQAPQFRVKFNGR